MADPLVPSVGTAVLHLFCTVGEGSGEDFSVGEAKVVCGDVQTANATVYIIDGVLLPAAN